MFFEPLAAYFYIQFNLWHTHISYTSLMTLKQLNSDIHAL